MQRLHSSRKAAKEERIEESLPQRAKHTKVGEEMFFLRALRVLCFALSLECRLRLESGKKNSSYLARIEEKDCPRIEPESSQRKEGRGALCGGNA